MTTAKGTSVEVIAASQAVSLAMRELQRAMLTLPYERLGDLAELRATFDRAQAHLNELRRAPLARSEP